MPELTIIIYIYVFSDGWLNHQPENHVPSSKVSTSFSFTWKDGGATVLSDVLKDTPSTLTEPCLTALELMKCLVIQKTSGCFEVQPPNDGL